MPDVDAKPSKEPGIWDSLLSNPLVLFTALGVTLYALSRGGYQVYFSHYDVTPEEVGLDYITLLSREAVPVAVLLVFILVCMSPLLMARRRRAMLDQNFINEMLDDAKSEDERRDIRRAVAREEAAIRSVEQDRAGRLLRVGAVAAALMLGLWLITLYATAYFSIELGKVPVAPLQVEVHPVKVSWLTATGETTPITRQDLGLPRRCGKKPQLLYLGQANNLVVFFAECADRPVRLPRDRIYLS